MVTSIRRISWGLVATLVVGTLASASVILTATPALAGGSLIYPVHDRYEAGDSATLVGYGTGSGTLGSVADGPFFGYLRTTHRSDADSGPWAEMAPFTPRPTDLPLGPVDVTPTGKGGYLEYRVAFRFTIPSWLAPGTYPVLYCNADCTKGIADLMNGWINVGVDPAGPITRSWPTDEPEIANLQPNTTLSGPGWTVTASELQSAERSSIPLPRGTVRSAKHLQKRLRAMTSVQRDGTVLCVDNTAVHVYEFETAAARRHATFDVRRNQATVANYFARGHIIAVVRGNDPRVLDEMTAVMGPTITPDAIQPPLPEVCA
jgi:hypothetical protein